MIKVIFSDDGTLKDHSVNINDYQSGTATLSSFTTLDKLFIGQRMPFNHLYLKMSTPGDTVSNIIVKIWDGQSFKSVAEVIDETSTASKTLGQSGFITWVPDKDQPGWSVDDTDDMTGTDLTSLKIYDLYWLEMTVSVNINTDIIIDWMGNLFSDDDDLYAEFPIFDRSNMKTAFKTGKTDWEEQHVRAAELTISDLVSKNVMDGSEQILAKEQFKLASVQKCAELIFGAFGDDYKDDLAAARVEYQQRLSSGVYKIDRNRNANLDPFENIKRLGYLSR